MAFPSQQTLRDTILPLAGVLEAIVSSKASKGQNISRTAFDAVDAMREREKEQEAARIAAIDRAAKAERDKTTLDILKETARQGRVKFEADDAERQFKENSKKAAVDRLLGIPNQYDEKTNTVTRSGVPGVSGLTDLDKVAIQADPLEWLTNRMKPQSVSVIAADGGFYTLPKSGGVATPVQTEAGAPIKPPPKPAPSERPTQPPKGYRFAADGASLEFIPGGPADPKNRGGRGLDGKAPEERREESVFKSKDKLRDIYEKTGTARAVTLLNDVAKKIGGVDNTGNIPGYGSENLKPQALLSQEGKDVRTSLAGLRNITLKDRSGAAVTNPEFDRLKEEIGGGMWSTDADLRSKLKRMGEIVSQHAKDIDATFQGDPEIPRQAFEEYRQAGGITGAALNLNPQRSQGSEIPTVRTDEDFENLPSGAVFIDPDGIKRRKP